MQNEKKELLKKFKTVVDDLMDHYEEYTDEEKAQIKDKKLQKEERGLSGHKTIVYSNVIIEDFRIVRRNVVRNDYF